HGERLGRRAPAAKVSCRDGCTCVRGLIMASKPKAAVKEAEAEEVDAGEDVENESAAPKRKLPLRLILMAVGGLVVLGGGGATAFLFLHHTEEEKAAVPAVKPAVFLDVPEVLVNLSNSSAERTQYLKVKVVLELSDQALIPQIQPV